MLQAIHDKITGWVAAIVIGAIGVTFVFWGIDVGFGTASYAAKVEGYEWPMWRAAEKVSAQEVGQIYQNQVNQYQQMMRGELPEEVRKGLQQQILDAVVRRELVLQHANHLGYRVREQDITRSIEQEEAFQVDGKFNEEVATRMLGAQGISTVAYRENLRQELQGAQLQAAIAASAFVTPDELERARRLEEQEREIAWTVIDPRALTDVAAPDEAAIAAYYKAHKTSYMTPDTVTLKYAELRLEDIAPTIEVNDDALRAEYDQVKERYVTAERRRARHILVNMEGKDEPTARKKADEILAKARASGADFSKLARELSEDAGSAQQGGDLGWAERSFFVGPFSDALFAMQKDEIRGPVRSEFGYHVIRLDGIEAGHQKTFEEVRGELESEYRTAQAERIFGERQEILAEKAFENPDSLEAAAGELKLQVKSIPDFRREGGAAPFAGNAAVIEAAFNDSVLAGQNSEPIELDAGNVLVLRSEDRKPPQQKPLAEVREQVVQAVRQQSAEQLARSRGEAALKKLNEGTSWAAVVAELKMPAQGPKFVKRTDQEVPAGLRQAVFLASKPDNGKAVYQGVAMPEGGYGLLAVTNVRSEAAPSTPEQVQARTRQLAGRMAQTEVASYIAELRRRGEVDLNPKIFE